MLINGNRLATLGPKYTGGLWVYIVTPLPNPLGNTGVMVCMCIILPLRVEASNESILSKLIKGTLMVST